MKHILLVEDDQRLANLIQQFLTQHNFKVTVHNTGDTVVEFVAMSPPDLILLDIMLPGLDGFSIIKEIRKTFMEPILFLTAKDSDFDHVKGLELGGDDYIIKPVEPHVLLARINAALRRYKATEVSDTNMIHIGNLTVDHSRRMARLNDQDIELTSHEFELLWLLATKPDEVQSRDVIHQQMIGREYDGFDRSVDVRVSRLRKKLHDDLDNPTRIITVWGKGYVLSSTAWG